MRPTIGDFYGFAAAAFHNLSPTGASGLVAEVHKSASEDLKSQPANLQTVQEAAQRESEHVLAQFDRSKHSNAADVFAYMASLGGGFSVRNLTARAAGSLLPDAYVGNNPQEQKILDIHKRNIVENPFY